MGISKSVVSATGAAVGSSFTVSAGTPYTGPWVDLTGAYGAELNVQISNGGTGPTAGATVQVQVANDYNGGTPTSLIANYGGALQAGTTANTSYSWSLDLPLGVGAVRIYVAGNTGQSVGLQADLDKVTSL